MKPSIDYFFTPQSPWTYLGHARFAALAREAGATVRVLPADYGRVFPVSGGLPLAKRAPQRQAYRLVELKRFGDFLGLPINIQPKFFPVSGDAAASIWRQVRETHLAPIEYRVLPRLPLPVEQLDSSIHVDPPALIKGYLRLGARVLGAPAWDPDFNTADLPMLMRLADLHPRYRKHFLGV